MPRLARSRLPTAPNRSRHDCHSSTRSVWFLRAAAPLLAAETYNGPVTAGSPMHHRRLHRVPGVGRPRSAAGPTPLGAEESLPGVDHIPKIRRSCSDSGNVHPDAAESLLSRLNARLQKSSHECETHADRNHSNQRHCKISWRSVRFVLLDTKKRRHTRGLTPLSTTRSRYIEHNVGSLTRTRYCSLPPEIYALEETGKNRGLRGRRS